MIFGLKKNIYNKILKIFKVCPEIEEVIIYGSRAKGNSKNCSDIDLTLKGQNLSLDCLNKVNHQLDDLLLPYLIELSIYDQIDNYDLIEHIDRVGKIFYKR